jgi:hypothetical protein
MPCPHCADHLDHRLARRIRVLQLLALIEHPDALPTDAALRIGQELLAWLGGDDLGCHAVSAPAARVPEEAQA